MLEVLDAEGVPDRVVMHCFSGDADFARACLDRGAWLSFAGPVTFKPNEHLREALRITPLDRILTETDAPYLTPVPFRGRPNASYLIPHTARFLAEALDRDLGRGLPGAGRERGRRVRRPLGWTEPMELAEVRRRRRMVRRYDPSVPVAADVARPNPGRRTAGAVGRLHPGRESAGSRGRRRRATTGR